MQETSQGLWRNTNFRKLWIGKTISDIGNGITGIALPLTAVLVLSATSAQMGILSALSGASVLLFSLFAGDIFVETYLINEISLRQSIIPSHLLGRANASMQFLSGGIGPIGALLAGVLGTFIGIRITLLLGVLGVIVAGLCLLLSPVRKMDTIVQ